MIRLAVDGMGGDFAPKEIVLGTLEALNLYENIEIVLFGNKEAMAPYLKEHKRLEVIDVPNAFDMGVKDIGIDTIRKKDYSMIAAMYYVKEGKADALVSAGPTQVLVFGSQFIIKPLKGLERCAIAPLIPSLDGKPTYLLDAGGNINTKAEHMLGNAIFTTVALREVFGVEKPQVGLINIGTEVGKGRDLDREAYELLDKHPAINFYGNLEPKEILSSEASILLSDGFTANIVMKTMEGTAKAMGQMLKREIKASIWSKIGAVLFMKKALKNFKKSMSPDEIGGALIAGLSKVVIKAHGSSSAYAFSNAIRQAKTMVEKDVIGKVEKALG
ncbi:phosphate acyltransferase PlsX [Acholeplasma equirhinis]|uniref:phosphate acyltransferase PlsX n=1 Tax=Acholeplasma equirhinis TaxID=555393 RepID=UPI00197AE359|nr:phosphate acyltransferase PlsX [Acholeplasma equirhinis]MBN3490817.1 phosphate acyltransferase PlsX [Acholeplasma equirhinis]